MKVETTSDAMAAIQLGGLAVIAVVIVIAIVAIYWKLTHFTFPDITGMWRSYSREKSLEAGAILEPKSIQDYMNEGVAGQDLVTVQAGVGAGTVAPLNTTLVQGITLSKGVEGIAIAQSVTERTVENNFGMIGAAGVEGIGTPPAPRYDIINQAWE